MSTAARGGAALLRLAANKALLVALVYLLLGMAWILWSDRAVEALFQDAVQLTRVQTWKG
ncbi:hypothetical protein LJB71_13805 [Thermomonas sp. S9]|uniref:hypothetical protein n=1 Tax=Thermomonas sp. S9 TaxID=2885203 RepID=UPI00216AB8D3|nr:hypothetical protein [Thermomonas sp. S9]MCR6497190.1 hypothetical protein [Thermomonas sp. S9]